MPAVVVVFVGSLYVVSVHGQTLLPEIPRPATTNNQFRGYSGTVTYTKPKYLFTSAQGLQILRVHHSFGPLSAFLLKVRLITFDVVVGGFTCPS